MWMLLSQKRWAKEDYEGRERCLKELQVEMKENKRWERLHEEQEREHARQREAAERA